MGLVPEVRSKDAFAAIARNGAEIISVVLPEVQERNRYQCQTFYNRSQAAVRKDAVLIIKPIMCASFFMKSRDGVLPGIIAAVPF